MKNFKNFDVETKINFSDLPSMIPLEKTNSSGSPIWRFTESMVIWWHDQHRKKYTLVIPTGFLTDFASTPKWIHWWLPPWNPKYTPACLPHDFGYERNGNLTLWVEDERNGLRTPMATKWSRLAIDQLMLAGMKSRNVGFFTEQSIYRAVRVGGGGAWKNARKTYLKGEDTRRKNLGFE